MEWTDYGPSAMALFGDDFVVSVSARDRQWRVQVLTNAGGYVIRSWMVNADNKEHAKALAERCTKSWTSKMARYAREHLK